MFPKIPSLNNKLSLYSLIFLKKQNEIKFYKAFYKKIFQNSKNKEKHKPDKNYLSLLSKSQNNFYSLPIKYNLYPFNLVIKRNDNLQNNNLNNQIPIKKEDLLLNKSNSNQINILHNKNLKTIHEYLIKNKNNQYLSKRKQCHSCKDIYMDNSSYNNDNENDNDNSIINDKISRGQQTVSNGPYFYENKNNHELKINNFSKDKKYDENINNKIKSIIKNNDKKEKFTINFQKSSKIYCKNSNGRSNKINVIWRNLRRPISMSFISSIKIN